MQKTIPYELPLETYRQTRGTLARTTPLFHVVLGLNLSYQVSPDQFLCISNPIDVFQSYKTLLQVLSFSYNSIMIKKNIIYI